MFTLQSKKLKFFVISERELLIITSCERLRTGDDWCEIITDNYIHTYIHILFPCGEWISKSAQLLEEHSIFIKCSSGLQE